MALQNQHALGSAPRDTIVLNLILLVTVLTLHILRQLQAPRIAAELHQSRNTITNVLPAIMEDSGKSLPPVPICVLRDFTALVLL